MIPVTLALIGLSLIGHALYLWSPGLAEALAGVCLSLSALVLAGRSRTPQATSATTTAQSGAVPATAQQTPAQYRGSTVPPLCPTCGTVSGWLDAHGKASLCGPCFESIKTRWRDAHVRH